MTTTKTLDAAFLATVSAIGQDETTAYNLMGGDNAFRSPIMRLVAELIAHPTAYAASDADAVYSAFTSGRVIADNSRKAGLAKLSVTMALAHKPHGAKTWDAFVSWYRSDNKPKTGSVYELWLKHARTARDASNVVMTTDDPNAPPIPAGMVGVDQYLSGLFTPAEKTSDPTAELIAKLRAEAKRLEKLQGEVRNDLRPDIAVAIAQLTAVANATEKGISGAAAKGQSMEAPTPAEPAQPAQPAAPAPDVTEVETHLVMAA